MMTAYLQRLDHGDEGTFGRLIIGPLVFFTGELPWVGNANDISCIPEGAYLCKWTYSNRFKRNMYLVDQVPNRTGIRAHSANLMGSKALGFKAQLNGCVALGEKLGWINGQKALLLSAPALRRFETLMGGQSFKLEVTNG